MPQQLLSYIRTNKVEISFFYLLFLYKASDKELFNSSYHWLLIEDYNANSPKDETIFKQQEEGSKTTIIKFLNKLNFNMNTELILAKKLDQDHEDYLLFDVW